MDKINVLSLARMRLHREYIDDIAAVDARISVIDGTEKFIVDTYGHRITGLFCENLRRYLAGKQLLNLIDGQKEY